MKKTIIETIVMITLAAFVAYIGGMTRPYEAFGGEDMLALVLVVYALHDFVVDMKAHKRKSRRAKASTSGRISVYH
jgi:hypothetical protein